MDGAHMPVPLAHPDGFVSRHIGPDEPGVAAMLRVCGAASLAQLIDQTVPASIRLARALDLPPARSEHELLDLAHAISQKNEVCRTFIGMGYHDTVTPPVILRNV